MSTLQPLADGAWRLALRTPTLPPATTTNTLVVGASRLLVIEPASPWGEEQRALQDALDRLAAEGRRVVAIAITHHHADHTGAVEALRQRLGVPVYAHAQTAARVGFAIDRLLADGDAIELGEGHEVRCVHTPGHAPGHLVLHDLGSGLAHAGDMVAGEGTILVDPHDDGDMAQYLDSLRRLGQLGASALVPAHGPVLTDPAAVVDHYVAHRLMREDKVLAAIGPAWTAIDEILARAYADTPRPLWPLAERSLEAHLRKLATERRIERGAKGSARAGGPPSV